MKNAYPASRIMTSLAVLAMFMFFAPSAMRAQTSDVAVSLTPMLSPLCGNTLQLITVRTSNAGPDAALNYLVSVTIDGVHAAGSPLVIPSLASGSFQDDVFNYSFPKAGKHAVLVTVVPGTPADPNLPNNSTSQIVTVLFNGTYTVGSLGTDHFSTIKMAVDTLNNYGLCGPTVVQVSAGHIENNVNISLNATGTAVNTLTIIGVGTPKPLIQSLAGGSGSILTNTFMNFGDAFFRINGGDYVTIDGIDVKEGYPGSDATLLMEYGYMVTRATNNDGAKNIQIKNCNVQLNRDNVYTIGIYQSNYSGAGALTNPVAVAGIHENTSYSGNRITNVYNGIVLRGYNAPSPYTLYDQNTNIGGAGRNVISNFGGGNQMATGIYVSYQNRVTIANDSINGGDSTTVSLFGIYLVNGINSSATVYNNKLLLYPFAASSPSYGIANSLGSTGSGNMIRIHSNTIESMVNNQATTASISGIYNNVNADTVSIYDNIISNMGLSGNGTLSAIDAGSPLHLFIYSNNINSFSKSGSGSLYGIRTYTGIIDVHHNTLNNLNASATASYVYGIYNISIPTTDYYYFNTIQNLNNAGQGMVEGIHLYGATSGRICRDNVVSQLYSADSTVVGMYLGVGKSSVYRNKIYNLQSSSPGSISFVSAIQIMSGNKTEIYNNFISEIKAPSLNSASAIRAIYLANATTDTTLIYYNSIFLNATGVGATFGNSGIYFSNNSRPDLRNNIIVNKSNAKGTAYAAAIYSANPGVSNYVSTSNNNCLYAGVPSAKNVIFANVAASDQTISAFKTRMSPRDSASFTENVPFVNAATAPYDLHISLTIPTLVASGGLRVTSPIAVTTDYDNNIRQGEIGYAGTGTAPDVGADEGDYTRLENDIYVVSIDKPRKKYCFTASDTVAATIKNITLKNVDFALTPITFTATVSDGITVQTFNLLKNSGLLKPDSTLSFTLTTNAVMNVHGSYVVKVYHNWGLDQIRTNDTARLNLMVYNPEIQSITADDSIICKWSPAQLLADVSAFGGGSSELNLSGTNVTAIPDPGVNNSPIIVTGAGGQAFEVLSVIIDSLMHPVAGDLDILLMAPNGSTIDLTSDNGSTASNYLRTEFTMEAVTPISTGSAPFTGLYLPEETFLNLQGIANGTWRLVVTDDNAGVSGTLYKWSLTLKTQNTITTYTWTPSGSLSAQNIANPVATPVTNTTYLLTAVDELGCVSLPDSIRIYVNPAYRDTVLYEICAGDSMLVQGAWQHTSGYYTDNDPTALGCDSVTVANLIVNTVYNDTVDVTICLGDSIYAAGAWQFTAGLYLDHGYTAHLGCDSLVYTDLHVIASYHDTLDIHICMGDSVFANGAWRFTSGMYVDNLNTVLGCDSITWTDLTVEPLPVVFLGNDTIQCWNLSINLNAGNAGATYLWSDGETGQFNVIDSSDYWLGSHDIWVQVNNGCVNTDTIRVSFDPCTGIQENTPLLVEVYPNPTHDKVYLRQLSKGSLQQYAVYNSAGELMLIQNVLTTATFSNLIEIDLSPWPAGVYYIRMYDGTQQKTVSIIKE